MLNSVSLFNLTKKKMCNAIGMPLVVIYVMVFSVLNVRRNFHVTDAT